MISPRSLATALSDIANGVIDALTVAAMNAAEWVDRRRER